MKILITGGSGFLGKKIIKELASMNHEIFVHSRQPDFKLKNDFEGIEHLTYVQGDITSLEIIAKEKDRQKIIDEIEVVIHAAALYEIGASYSDCFLQNVVGTQNVLHFLGKLKNLRAFYYVSTIAVGDPETFFLEENQLQKRSSFSDKYSETKYLAELCVRENLSDKYVTRIIRPGIIVGDSVNGDIPKTDGPYYFIEAFKKYKNILGALPAVLLAYNPRTKMPIIPVDHCARFIALLVSRDQMLKVLKTYHLITPDSPSVAEFLSDLNERFELKTHYIPVKKNPLSKRLLKQLGIPNELESFMFSKLSYDKTSTLEDLPELEESSYAQFKSVLLK